MSVLSGAKYCPACREETFFFIGDENNLRDTYICTKCNSRPKERALFYLLNCFRSNWEQLRVYEISPSHISFNIFNERCKNYIASQFYLDIPPGEHYGDYICQNIECLTFKSGSFDVVVSVDVFEHVFDPRRAFQEIARVLAPRGIHIFTVPLGQNTNTRRLAGKKNNEIIYLETPSFHYNPVDTQGTLVTMEYGCDLSALVLSWAGTPTSHFIIQDPSMGIVGAMTDVFISFSHQNFDINL